MKKTAKRTTLTISQIHRKEHGIYYTPTHIVDYIVRHTLGTLLEEKDGNGRTIRILDPACGSGSFLIKAFDIFNEYYLKHDANYYQTQLDTRVENGTYTRRLRILEDHIFGVDMDKQAVEVAQLNLLLKVAERGRRLPLLQQNIKQGNSLMDISLDPEDRAFNWQQEFKHIFSDGGFDVIVGNPPYVFGGSAGIRDQQKIFFQHNYISAKRKLNLFSLFIERSIHLLKNGGLMAFILPNTLLRVTSYEEIRKFILDRTKIIQIVNLESGVFEKVTASTIIIILQKEANKDEIKNNQIKIIDGLWGHTKTKSQLEFINNLHIFDLGLSSEADNTFFEKLDFGSIKLGTICQEMIFGVVITKNKDEVVSNRKLNVKYKIRLRIVVSNGGCVFLMWALSKT